MNENLHTDESIEFETNFLKRISEHDRELNEKIENYKVVNRELTNKAMNEPLRFATAEDVNSIFNDQTQTDEEV